MWAPRPPERPAPGWWTELAEARERAELDQWIEGIAADMRAEKLERLEALRHRIQMRASGALQAAEWNRIQRRRDQRSVRSHGGYLVESAGYSPEIERSGHAGRVLDVR
jgi:hypothetical protein